ncbi:MAG: restriction endonuclease subunit S [Candidatus Aminicenantes bacterium]|nr:restriction endonuclease subunit S [Candidatus Aminicenantes bacterium]
MGERKEYKLADVAIDFAMGPFGSNIKAENFIESGVPVIRGKNLNFYKYVGGDFVCLSDEKADELKKSNCFPNDLVFTHRGTIGQVGLIPKGKYPRYVVSQSGMKLTVDKNKLDENYLFYFFKSDIGQYELLKNESQVGVPAISSPLSSLKSVDLTLPPLPEQKAIASVLSSLDDKIDLLHRQNKTLEAMAETLFRQWFVEEAQKDWEIVKLDSLINISSGKGLKKEHLSENGAYPVLGANGEIGRTNEFLFNESLLFTGRVGTLGNIFRVENEKVWLSDNTLVIKPKNYFNFIYFVLKTAKLEEYNVGSTQPLIRQSDIKEIEISLPSENKLHEFEKESDLLLNKIRQNKSQIRTLEKLRNTLLPKLIRGEVRVNYEN